MGVAVAALLSSHNECTKSCRWEKTASRGPLSSTTPSDTLADEAAELEISTAALQQTQEELLQANARCSDLTASLNEAREGHAATVELLQAADERVLHLSQQLEKERAQHAATVRNAVEEAESAATEAARALFAEETNAATLDEHESLTAAQSGVSTGTQCSLGAEEEAAARARADESVARAESAEAAAKAATEEVKRRVLAFCAVAAPVQHDDAGEATSVATSFAASDDGVPDDDGSTAASLATLEYAPDEAVESTAQRSAALHDEASCTNDDDEDAIGDTADAGGSEHQASTTPASPAAEQAHLEVVQALQSSLDEAVSAHALLARELAAVTANLEQSKQDADAAATAAAEAYQALQEKETAAKVEIEELGEEVANLEARLATVVRNSKRGREAEARVADLEREKATTGALLTRLAKENKVCWLVVSHVLIPRPERNYVRQQLKARSMTDDSQLEATRKKLLSTQKDIDTITSERDSLLSQVENADSVHAKRIAELEALVEHERDERMQKIVDTQALRSQTKELRAQLQAKDSDVCICIVCSVLDVVLIVDLWCTGRFMILKSN